MATGDLAVQVESVSLTLFSKEGARDTNTNGTPVWETLSGSGATNSQSVLLKFISRTDQGLNLGSLLDPNKTYTVKVIEN